MATVSLVIILLVEDAVFRAATVVAVASSAFTICPPAAGTALGLVIHGWSWSAVVFILSSALALSMIRLVLRPRLINLL